MKSHKHISFYGVHESGDESGDRRGKTAGSEVFALKNQVVAKTVGLRNVLADESAADSRRARGSLDEFQPFQRR